ncbi:MAG TPA: hypothetical protein PLL06_17075, partial [Acidobacteriota bacterium]|nr:hypothetical protein [Acidobacteriota bacterium]
MIESNRFSPGWALESSRWAACFEAHPPESRPRMVRARMGAGKSVWGGMVEFGTIEVVIQRPSGRDSVRSGRDSGGSSQSLATTG